MAERIIQADDAELCTESFGDPSASPLLLIAGIGSSMLWWEAGLCRLLAARDRFVIRYDHRDTGRSTTYEVASPGYTADDLNADALAVLDAYDVSAAHLVGVSAGGGIAQLLALDHPGRVSSCVLISTTRAVPGGRDLPPPTDEFMRFVSAAEVDWSSKQSVIEYLVEYMRVLAGAERPFDESAARDFVRRDVERAHDIAATQNHDSLAEGDRQRAPLGSIEAPVLVVHGTADPMFPLAHGEALADEIPGARLLTLSGAGHGVYREDWETLAGAIAEHTAG